MFYFAMIPYMCKQTVQPKTLKSILYYLNLIISTASFVYKKQFFLNPRHFP